MDRFANWTRRAPLRSGIIAVFIFLATFAARPALAQANQPLGELDKMLTWLAALAMSLAEVIGKLVIAVIDVTIPVMQYQGFTTSPVVIAGWALVRDTVNMFFVVVLIIIAMGTIFGVGRFEWKRQVPRLLIFAIVINFSKTLCGLMIDFAQVIMITFANALKDIAGGNFIQLLGLGDIFSLSEKAETIAAASTGTGVGSGPFDFFAASVAAVLMMVWVFAVVLMLLFILVYRVVMLWILIVLAPLAWFLGGSQGIIKSDAYSEWWKNFICYTAIGPIITFFLWLTLAVAGAGFIAANDPGFSAAVAGGDISSNASDIVTRIFELQRLTSFIVGMAMLMVGLDAASKICSGVKKAPGFDAVMGMGKGGGFINRFVGRQGSKYGGKALSAGWSGTKSAVAGMGTGVGTGLLAATVGGAGVGALAPTAAGQAARAKGLRDLSKKSWVPNSMATKLSTSADARQADLAKQLKEGTQGAFKDASSETKLDYLARIAKDGRIPVGQDANAYGLFAEALKDRKMREKLEASGTLNTLYRDMGMGANLKARLRNTPDAKTLDEFEEGRPDVTGNFTGINSEEDLRKLDPTALARLKGNAAFEAQIAGFKTSVRNAAGTDSLNGLEFLNGGNGNAKQVRAWENGMTGVYEGMGNATLALVPPENIAPNATEALIQRHATATGRPDAAAKALASHGSVAARERAYASPGIRREMNTRAFGATYTATGAMATVDAARVKAAVKDDVFAVKNVSRADMTSDMSEAVADAYSDNAKLQELVDQYFLGNADAREEMDSSVLSNVLESFDRAELAASTAGDTTRETMLATKRAALLTELEAVRGGNASMVTQLNAQLTGLTAEEAGLSAVARPSADQARRLVRVREDVGRITRRIAMH